MCGRFTHMYTWRRLHELYDAFLNWAEATPDPDGPPARFNVAPTQAAPVILDRGGPKPEAVEARWGFSPPPGAPASRLMINARIETAHERRMFKDALAHRRCLVPADGFYEWQKLDARTKQPWYLTARDREPFFFAGLWREGEGGAPEFVILTGEPVDDLSRSLHDRAPMVVTGHDLPRWLDPEITRAAPVDALALAFGDPEAFEIEGWRVGKGVNSPARDAPELIEPDEGERTLFG